MHRRLCLAMLAAAALPGTAPAAGDALSLDNAALRAWAGNDRVLRAFADWLIAAATPDDWHQVAQSWNFNNGRAPMPWILSRPTCDRATALFVFWKFQPEYYIPFNGDRTAVDSDHREIFDQLEALRQRWRSGFYTGAELAFDLARDTLGRIDPATLDRVYGPRALRDLPPDMRGPLPGRRLPRGGLIEGIPERFWRS